MYKPPTILLGTPAHLHVYATNQPITWGQHNALNHVATQFKNFSLCSRTDQAPGDVGFSCATVSGVYTE